MSTTSTDFESIFVEINSNRGNSVIVGVIYRPPSGKIENFNDQLEAILSQIPENTRAYIMGDYKIDMFKDNKITSAFEESFISHGFFSSISIATHVKPNCRNSCLDNILTNNPDLVLSSCTINSDISHHRSIILITQLQCLHRDTNPQITSKPTYDFCKQNLEQLSRAIENTLFQSPTLQIDNFELLLTIIQSHINETCKVSKSTNTKRTAIHNPWITKGIINSIRKRDKLYKIWKKTVTKICKSGDPRKYVEYRKYRNNLSRVIKPVQSH